jgi:hypothetical protein
MCYMEPPIMRIMRVMCGLRVGMGICMDTAGNESSAVYLYDSCGSLDCLRYAMKDIENGCPWNERY